MDAEEQPWPSTPYSGEFHLTALRTPGTVLRQGGFLPRHIAASCPPGKSKDDTRASYRSPRPLSEETKERLRSARHRLLVEMSA